MITFKVGLDILKVTKVVLHMFFSHNYTRIRIDSYDSLPLEKTLTLHNVIILVKPVFDKNQKHYYYGIFI